MKNKTPLAGSFAALRMAAFILLICFPPLAAAEDPSADVGERTSKGFKIKDNDVYVDAPSDRPIHTVAGNVIAMEADDKYLNRKIEALEGRIETIEKQLEEIKEELKKR